MKDLWVHTDISKSIQDNGGTEALQSDLLKSFLPGSNSRFTWKLWKLAIQDPCPKPTEWEPLGKSHLQDPWVILVKSRAWWRRGWRTQCGVLPRGWVGWGWRLSTRAQSVHVWIGTCKWGVKDRVEVGMGVQTAYSGGRGLGAVTAEGRRRQWHPTPVLLPGKSHGWRSLVGCSPRGHEESDMTEQLHFHFSLSCTGEGNGNPLRCSCRENPRDRGACWAAIHGVTQSRTWLRWLSSSSRRGAGSGQV